MRSNRMLQLTVFCGPLARSLVRSYGDGVIVVEPTNLCNLNGSLAAADGQ